jgi:hypothetical protein
MPEERWFSRWGVCAVALSVGLVACGGFGVERYREAAPHGTLELRRVAADGRVAAEVLPRLDGSGEVPLEPGAILRAPHVAHVQLLEGADGERLLVLQLRDEGRLRIGEATAGGAVTLALVSQGRVLSTPSVRGALDQSEIAVRVAPEQTDAAYAVLRE